jgi:hypothetical protein
MTGNFNIRAAGTILVIMSLPDKSSRVAAIEPPWYLGNRILPIYDSEVSKYEPRAFDSF